MSEKYIQLETKTAFFNNETKMWESWDMTCYSDGSYSMSKCFGLYGLPLGKIEGNANNPFIPKNEMKIIDDKNNDKIT